MIPFVVEIQYKMLHIDNNAHSTHHSFLPWIPATNSAVIAPIEPSRLKSSLLPVLYRPNSLDTPYNPNTRLYNRRVTC